SDITNVHYGTVTSLPALPTLDDPRDPHSLPTRRSSDLPSPVFNRYTVVIVSAIDTDIEDSEDEDFEIVTDNQPFIGVASQSRGRSEEHTSELQSREKLVCRLLLEKKNE